MDDLTPWLDALIAKYGHVLDEVFLVGSRARKRHRPDSDWDVVLITTPTATPGDERAMTTDDDLPRPEQHLDLFIVRPDGDLVRWEPWGGEHLENGLFMGNWPIVDGMVEGPVGVFSRFFSDNADCATTVWSAS